MNRIISKTIHFSGALKKTGFSPSSSFINPSLSSPSSSSSSSSSLLSPSSSSISYMRKEIMSQWMLLFRPLNYCFMGTKALLKTNKSAAKRIRVRGSGSIKRNKGGASHNTGYKTRSRSNRLGQSCGIKEAKIEKRMRRLIGR